MTTGDLILRLVFQSLLALVLVFASVGFAAGIGLIVASAPTLRFFKVMNRWVSTRGALRGMEIPRDTEQLSHRNRGRVGWALIVGGAFSAFGLAIGFDPAALAAGYAHGDMVRLVVIVAGTLKWFLFVGSVAGVVIGCLLCFAPDAMASLERRANQWTSTRRAIRGGDDVHPVLDHLVEGHPAPAGWILACTTLGAAAYAIVLLMSRH